MKNKLFKALICVFTLTFLLTGCKDSVPTISKVESGELQFQGVKNGDTIATIKTSLGDIKIILYPQLAPLAVENFVTLAQEGYYDGIVFHRVIEGFMVQSGDPTAQGNGGKSIWDLPFNDEFSDQLHNYTGAVSMANSGENSNTSQFFIVTESPKDMTEDISILMQNADWREDIISTYKQSGGAPQLDYKHTVFGHVYEGLDIAFKISKVKTDENDRPKEDIIIETIEISKADIQPTPEPESAEDKNKDEDNSAEDKDDAADSSDTQSSESADTAE